MSYIADEHSLGFDPVKRSATTKHYDFGGGGLGLATTLQVPHSWAIDDSMTTQANAGTGTMRVAAWEYRGAGRFFSFFFAKRTRRLDDCRMQVYIDMLGLEGLRL